MKASELPHGIKPGDAIEAKWPTFFGHDQYYPATVVRGFVDATSKELHVCAQFASGATISLSLDNDPRPLP